MCVPLAFKGILFLTFAVIANSEDLVLDDENFVDMMGEQNIADKIGGLDFFNEMVLGTPSKKKNFIFSDIVQKGRRGSGSNHYFRTFRNNDGLVGWEGDEESVSLFLWPL